MATAVISVIGYVLTTLAYVRIYKVVKYHQNQMYSQNQLQNAETREAHKQRKSAYNSLFVSVVFVACYLPLLPSTMLYWTNTTEISFPVVNFASIFLIYLNSSLNPLLLAVSRDSPKCKKHSKANISHERQHVIRKEIKLWIV